MIPLSNCPPIKKQDDENTHASPKHTGKPRMLREVGERAGVICSTVLRWLHLPPAMRPGHVGKNGFVMAWKSRLRDFLRRHGL